MARPKSPDPAHPITITLPESILQAARRFAWEEGLALSTWIAGLVRRRIQKEKKTR